MDTGTSLASVLTRAQTSIVAGSLPRRRSRCRCPSTTSTQIRGWRIAEKPAWYYQRTFQPHDAWRTQRLVLRFGAVSYRAAVWLNGHFVGEHETATRPSSLT